MPKNPIIPIEQEYDRHIDPLEDIAEDPISDVMPIADEMMEELPDGSVTIVINEDEEIGDGDFQDNLAESMESNELNAIAIDLLDLIDKDQQARSRRDEQYAEGIRRTGLGDDAPGGADFSGASKVVHPVMAEGCIDFSARAIKEIFPPSGPCKIQIIGEATEDKIEKAERKKTYMNWQLTKQISEYRAEMEQMLTQLPLGGSQYIKIWYDDRCERPRAEFVPIDDMFLPFSVSDFYSSHRKTHRQMLTKHIFESRIKSGLYRDIEFYSPSDLNEKESDAKKATDKIEGLDATAYNEDGLRTIYEIYVYQEFDDDPFVTEGCSAPYIITIDESSKKVLAIYRNWEDSTGEEDKSYYECLEWIVEFKFIPWRGAYGIGLPHIIGSMSGALTGALRALMDSAHINNMPGMLKLKGNRTSGQSLNIGPTEVTEIEGPTGLDDVRKLAMPMPFNPPSPVLFQLLGWLTDQAKGVVGTAEERIADASNNMPVGTALALIEQGSAIFSAIHGRLHASQQKVLEILHRINRDHLDDEETVEELGSLVVSRRDFMGPLDVIPVSDPNIFSEAQRFAQLQSVLQLAQQFPQLYKAEKLNARALQLLNFPDAKDVLVEVPEPEELDAVHENIIASSGKQPLKAYEDQDHMSHMMLHLHYALSPIFCANPLMAMPALPALMAHITKEHLPMFYEQHVKAASGAMSDTVGVPEDDAKLQLQAAAIADRQMAQMLAPVMQMLQKAQQLMQQFSPPPNQLDPASQVQMQIGQAAIASKEKVDTLKIQQDGQIKTAELQQKQAQHDQETQIDAHANALAANAENQSTAVNQQNELIKNEQDNANALKIEQLRIMYEQEADARKEQAETLRHILTLLKQSSGTTQILGENYEQQQISAATQADRDGGQS